MGIGLMLPFRDSKTSQNDERELFIVTTAKNWENCRKTGIIKSRKQK